MRLGSLRVAGLSFFFFFFSIEHVNGLARSQSSTEEILWGEVSAREAKALRTEGRIKRV